MTRTFSKLLLAMTILLAGDLGDCLLARAREIVVHAQELPGRLLAPPAIQSEARSAPHANTVTAPSAGQIAQPSLALKSFDGITALVACLVLLAASVVLVDDCIDLSAIGITTRATRRIEALAALRVLH